MPEDEEIVINVTEPTADAAAQGTELNAENETTSPNDSPAKANDECVAPGADAGTMPPARTKDVGATLRETEIHPHKWLKRGSRILFYFDQGMSADDLGDVGRVTDLAARAVSCRRTRSPRFCHPLGPEPKPHHIHGALAGCDMIEHHRSSSRPTGR